MRHTIFYIILILIFAIDGEIFGKSKKTYLLLLQSYHPNFAWSDNIGDGLYSKLSGKANEIEIKTEFLDAKDRRYQSFAPSAYQFLKEKYKDTPFDIIVTADGEALNAALDLRKTIGREGDNTPLFFTGINFAHFQSNHRYHDIHIPGVIEEVDYKRNIELMISLFPDAEEVGIINDGGPPSENNYSNLVAELKANPKTDHLKIIRIDGPEEKDIAQQIGQMHSEKSVLFLIGYFNFKFKGLIKENNAFFNLIRQHTRAPIFTFWEVYLHQELLGGHMLNGGQQGSMVADLVLRYHKGEKYHNLPIVTEETSMLYINEKIAQDLNLRKLIPRNAQLFNINTGPLDIFWKEFLIFIVVFGTLSILTIYLFILIVKKKRTEVQLSESLKKYKILVDKFPGGLWVINSKGEIQYLSEGFALKYKGLFSYEVKDSLNMKHINWQKIIHPNDLPVIKQAFFDLFEKRVPMSLEIRVKTVDNNFNSPKIEWRWFEIQANELTTNKGHEDLAVGVITDITDKKMILEKIAEAHHLESLGTLASGIAHDFNNILQGISTSIENIIEKQSANKEASNLEINKRLKDILDYQKRGSVLVRQILNFTGRHQTEKTPSLFTHKAQDSINMVRSLTPQQIKIVSHLEENLWCELDESKIGQIIVNLCTNSADALLDFNKDNPLIEVRATSIELDSYESNLLNISPRKYIKLVVTDNAMGINQEILPRIVEPFFTTKSQRMRTGMGLSIIHGIVKFHEGAFFIDSEKDLGTKITIYLPQIDPQEKMALSSKSINYEIENSLLNGKKILFVDDETRILELTSEILKINGLDIVTANDGQEAFELFLKSPSEYDFIVTDQSMPNKTGQELVIEIREIAKTIPIILVSGHISEALQKMASNDPYLMIIPKPYRKKQILDALIHFQMKSHLD